MMTRALPILAALLLAGGACAQTLPPTVNVTVLFQGPAAETITSQAKFRVKPHTRYTINDSDGHRWTIQPYWSSYIPVTSSTGTQVMPIVPNLAGSTGSVTYSTDPQTWYDYEFIGAPGQGSYPGMIQIPCCDDVDWGDTEIMDEGTDGSIRHLIKDGDRMIGPLTLADYLRLEPLERPLSPAEGTLYLDDDDGVVYIYINGSWVDMTASGAALTVSDVLAGTGITVTVVGGTQVRVTNAGVLDLEAGNSVAIGGNAQHPILNVDSSGITPTFSNLQAVPQLVREVQAGNSIVVGGSGERPIVSTDSGTITPTWANVQSKPALVNVVEAGVAVIVGGSAAAPIVNVDSTAITPTYGNVQGRPVSTVEALEAGTNIGLGGSSTRPIVNADSSSITPTWGNVQSKPAIVNTVTAGVNVSNSGSAADPILSADSATITPSFANITGLPSLVREVQPGTNVIVGGNVLYPIVSVDSATITPTFDNLVGTPSLVRDLEAGNSIVIGGNATHPIVSADSASITPTWPNVQGKPAVILVGLEAGNNIALGGSSTIPIVNADSGTITPSWPNVQGKPATLVEAIEGGTNVSVAGSSSIPIVSVDSSGITPTYSNVQAVPMASLLGNPTGGTAAASAIGLGDGLEFDGSNIRATGSGSGDLTGIDAGTNVGVQGADGPRPTVSTDSSTITPSWANVQSKPAIVNVVEAGTNVTVGGSAGAPIVHVDSAGLTPTFSNIQGTPSFVRLVEAGNNVAVGGNAVYPIVSTDSSTVTPSFANITGLPDLVREVQAGTNVAIGGDVYRPIVSADSATITPTWSNTQGKPAAFVYAVEAGSNAVLGGNSAYPIVNVDSTTLTPTYANVQGKPATLVESVQAGTNVVVGGSTVNPIVSADSATVTPTWGNVQGKPTTVVLLQAGTNVGIGGNQEYPIINADSSTITPTWTNTQGKPSTLVESIQAGTNMAVAGSSAVPIISADSASITPTWANVQSKPALVTTITAGTNVSNSGSSTDPVLNADSASITPTATNVQGFTSGTLLGRESGTGAGQLVAVGSGLTLVGGVLSSAGGTFSGDINSTSQRYLNNTGTTSAYLIVDNTSDEFELGNVSSNSTISFHLNDSGSGNGNTITQTADKSIRLDQLNLGSEGLSLQTFGGEGAGGGNNSEFIVQSHSYDYDTGGVQAGAYFLDRGTSTDDSGATIFQWRFAESASSESSVTDGYDNSLNLFSLYNGSTVMMAIQSDSIWRADDADTLIQWATNRVDIEAGGVEQLFADSTNVSIQTDSVNQDKSVVGRLYSSHIPGAETGDTTASEVNFPESFTLAANYLRTARCVRYRYYGVIDGAAVTTATFRTKLGTVAVVTSDATTVINGTGSAFMVQGEIVVATSGASGTVSGVQSVNMEGATVDLVYTEVGNSVVVDTTGTNVFQLSIQFSGSSASNGARILGCSVEGLN